MSWLIQTFCKILLGACAEIFGVFTDDFITSFGINIGANFPTIQSQVNGKSPSLADIMSSYPSNTGLSSVFDKFFPLSQYKPLFVSMAIAIATALLVKEIMSVMASPMTGSRHQRPVISALRYGGCVVGIVFSYRIFIVMEYIMNEFYVNFAKIALNGGVEGSHPIATMEESSSSSSFLNLIMDWNSWFGMDVAGDAAKMVISSIALSILSLVVTWILLISFLKLLIEIVERYVVLGMLFYTAPLPFASLVSDNTSDVFKAWIRMAFSEMLLIVTNSLFLGVFISAINNVAITGVLDGAKEAAASAADNLTGSGAHTSFSWAVMMFMLIAWLQMAQKFDSYLQSLGLSTAQTGGNLASAIVGGFTYGVGKVAGKTYQTAKSEFGKTPVGQMMKDKTLGQKAQIAGAGLSGGPTAAAAEAIKQQASSSMKQKGHFDEANALFGGTATKDFSPESLEKNKEMASNLGNVASGKLNGNAAYQNALKGSEVAFDGKGGWSLSAKDGSKLSFKEGGTEGSVVGAFNDASGKSLSSIRATVSGGPGCEAEQALNNILNYGESKPAGEIAAGKAAAMFNHEAGYVGDNGYQVMPGNDGTFSRLEYGGGKAGAPSSDMSSIFLAPEGVAGNYDQTAVAGPAIDGFVPFRSVAGGPPPAADRPITNAVSAFCDASSAFSSASLTSAVSGSSFDGGASLTYNDGSTITMSAGGPGLNMGNGMNLHCSGPAGSAAYNAAIAYGNNACGLGGSSLAIGKGIASIAGSQGVYSADYDPTSGMVSITPTEEFGNARSYMVLPAYMDAPEGMSLYEMEPEMKKAILDGNPNLTADVFDNFNIAIT